MWIYSLGIAKVFQVIAKARDIGDWTSPKDHEKMIYSVGKTHYFDPSLNLMVYQKEPHSLSLAIVNTESVGLGPFFSCGIPGENIFLSTYFCTGLSFNKINRIALFP